MTYNVFGGMLSLTQSIHQSVQLLKLSTYSDKTYTAQKIQYI